MALDPRQKHAYPVENLSSGKESIDYQEPDVESTPGDREEIAVWHTRFGSDPAVQAGMNWTIGSAPSKRRLGRLSIR
jgi:hypothetical protein